MTIDLADESCPLVVRSRHTTVHTSRDNLRKRAAASRNYTPFPRREVSLRTQRRTVNLWGDTFIIQRAEYRQRHLKNTGSATKIIPPRREHNERGENEKNNPSISAFQLRTFLPISGESHPAFSTGKREHANKNKIRRGSPSRLRLFGIGARAAIKDVFQREKALVFLAGNAVTTSLKPFTCVPAGSICDSSLLVIATIVQIAGPIDGETFAPFVRG